MSGVGGPCVNRKPRGQNNGNGRVAKFAQVEIDFSLAHGRPLCWFSFVFVLSRVEGEKKEHAQKNTVRIQMTFLSIPWGNGVVKLIRLWREEEKNGLQY